MLVEYIEAEGDENAEREKTSTFTIPFGRTV
jgi:hypothetical protein